MRKLIIRLATCFVVAILSSAFVVSCKPEEQQPANIPVTGVTISKTSINLTEEDTETLTASVTPADATNKTVNWSSSNTSVAKVDANGKVTAVGAGTANITAASADGYKTASCSVTVKGLYRALTKIELTPAESNLTFGKTVTLSVKYTPENASNKNVSWKSSNTDIVKVSANGTVEVVNEGTATITATSEDGGHKATAKITVAGTATPGLYYIVDRSLFKDGHKLNDQVSLNPSIDLENRLYYYSYSDYNIYVSGVPLFNYNINANWFDTAAGGGYYFFSNLNDARNELSVIKTNPTKRSAKTVSIHKSSTKFDVWLHDMAADTKGNLYVAGKTTRADGADIATLWKLDTNDKVTSTTYSNGAGSKSGPAVEAVSVNKNGDMFCLVYEGAHGTKGYQKINLYKNGKKLYQVTELCSMFSSQSVDLMAVGNDVYMSICESPSGTGSSTLIRVYKNQKVIYTIKQGDKLAAGDIFVTSKGDVYCAGHAGSGTDTKHYIWKNGKVVYSGNNTIEPHSLVVKE